MYEIALLLHILAATVWTGGHIVLATAILPQVLKQKDVAYLQRFESSYERVGIPALIIQVLTGLYLAHHLLPDTSLWLDWQNPLARIIQLKLALLLLTMMFALDARLRIIPNLSADRLVSLAFHIVPVTIISVLFVVVGVSAKTGWLYN